jgi:hypothetical protein
MTSRKKRVGQPAIQHARRALRPTAPAAELPSPRVIRGTFGLTRALFARAAGVSERKLADLEQGEVPRAPHRQRLVELERLGAALTRVIRADYLPEWMVAPNPAFDGLKPLEVIERGESDRLWQMIFELESGMLS